MRDQVLSAYDRIRPLVRETPLEYSADLGVWLKLEHLQKTGSFKFRGACNKIALLTPDQAAAGVVTASNGQSRPRRGGGGAGARRSPRRCSSHRTSRPPRPAASRLWARALHRAGDDPLTAELAARRAAEESGRVFISPYNDADVMAGQGTIGVEMLRQLPELDAVFVAVGGGGLIGGIGGVSEGGQARRRSGRLLAGEFACHVRVHARRARRRCAGAADAFGEHCRRSRAGFRHARTSAAA